MKAIFGIPDTVLSSVQLGRSQSIQTETYPEEFPGQVTAISPQADQKSRTFQVEVTLQNSKGLLKSGMVATLRPGTGEIVDATLSCAVERHCFTARWIENIQRLHCRSRRR